MSTLPTEYLQWAKAVLGSLLGFVFNCCITDYYKLGVLKHHRGIISEFFRPQIHLAGWVFS